MKKRILAHIVRIACILLLPASAFAQLPSPTYGWNLGNTLEATPTEGSWGPVATQNVINGVANAGFNTIRLPVSWDIHANQSTYQIDATWMARVKQVVDWCYAKNLYVIVNDHWDGGWLENHIGDTVDPTINAKMQSYWTQIANTFKNYDNHLIFAGANEPNADTASKWSTLRTYYNTFISAVRATGGNNSSRWLAIQGPNTNIDLSVQFITAMPSDPTPGRLILEVHYYDPPQWAILTSDASWGNMWYFWGAAYHSTALPNRNPTYGEESYLDTEFQKLVTNFINKGIPVMIGEFAAPKRTGYSDLTGTELSRSLAARTYWDHYVVNAANSRGIKPIYWDIAGITFDWTTGALVDSDNKTALTGGPALPPPGGGSGGAIANGTYKIISRNSGLALDVYGAATANGTNVDQWPYSGNSNQKWTVTSLGNNVYKIVGVQSGRALDVAGAGTANGTNVDIWDSFGPSNQQWQITATDSGYYRITPMNATGSCLDVSGGSTANGANVQIWQYLGGNNQQWAFQAP
ncbi:MAG TPA: cellulase family glycosylhydrolase [Opitutaceae bacterium]